MRRAALSSFLLLVTLARWPAHAAAQATSGAIAATDCDATLTATVDAALAVELSTASPEAREAFASGTLRAELVCGAEEVVAIVRRDDTRHEQRVARSARGLARRLALSLAEMLDAASTSPTRAPVPEAGPDAAPPAPPAGVPVRLRLGGGAWLGGEPLLAMGEAAIGVELAPVPVLAVVVDLAGSFGGVGVTAGSLDVRLASAGLSLRLGADLDVFRLSAGPALRGGAAFWTGHPRDPSRGTGQDLAAGWLGVGVVGAAHARLGELPLRLGLELEGGAVLYGSTALAYGEVAARIAGAWLEVRLVLDLRIV